jgi:hypothetical protein
MGTAFNYAKEFKSLDLNAVRVAGRLRPLRRADDPHGVARGGHVPWRSSWFGHQSRLVLAVWITGHLPSLSSSVFASMLLFERLGSCNPAHR